LAHEALGFLKYRKQDFPGAVREMELAEQLGSNSFATFYYHGSAILAGSTSHDDSVVQTAVQNFQRATQLNPLFAPAMEGLAQAYSLSPQTQNQALNAAISAVKLDPGEHRYSLNLAYLLLNNNRVDPARVIAQKLLAAAHSPQESQQAQELLSHISEREQWIAQTRAAHSATNGDPGADASPIASSSGATVAPAVSLHSSVPINSMTNVGVDGEISSIDCSHSPEITITLDLSKGPMILHVRDFRTIAVAAPDVDSMPKLEACEQWKGLQVKAWFHVVQKQPYLGEITKIYFH
jgi:hypothetical protein